MNNCIKCGIKIIGRQANAKYCSSHCSKLYLKAQYKKRNAERLKAYAREYRRAKNGGNRSMTWPARKRATECLKCGATEDLQLAHIKPLSIGGTHDYYVTFCRIHHMKYDNILKEFWYQME